MMLMCRLEAAVRVGTAGTLRERLHYNLQLID